MIRHLQWLTHSVPSLHSDALAIAVYAEPFNGHFQFRPAAEQGYEGVACIDDAARAAVLYCKVWQTRRAKWARVAADGLLHFVNAMQDDEGRFSNFLLDWDGSKNLVGSSSRPGGEWWTARAMYALACGVRTLGRDEDRRSFERGLRWMDNHFEYSGARAVALLAALEYWKATRDPGIMNRCLDWAELIGSCRNGDVLRDKTEASNAQHLWGHVQEAALAQAGIAFRRSDFVEIARRSAIAVLVPPVEIAFAAGTSTLPYDVSCAVSGLDEVARATGDEWFRRLADLGRSWFLGRNTASQPVFDRARGCVFDGIDNGHVSDNSGAEANIEGAFALFNSLPWEWYDELFST